jgi:hypothetical protein
VNDIDALRITSLMISAFQNVKSAVEQFESDVAYYDHEYNDLTHALELMTFDAAKGYQLAKQLKENRLKRRKAKDQLAQLQPLNELMGRYQNFFQELRRTQAQIEKIRTAQQNRIYTPRARTDMQEAFERAKERQVAKA